MPTTKTRRSLDPSRRGRRPRWILIVATLAVAIGIGGVVANARLFGAPGDGGSTVVVIEPGTSLRAIARQLEAERVVRSAKGFLLAAKLTGQSSRIPAGEFDLPRDADAFAVIDRLVHGPVVQHKVTIPEGYTVRQIATTLAASGIATKEEIDAVLADGPFFRALGVPVDSPEGYLFPDTYQFTRGYPARKLVANMVRRFFKTWDAAMEARAKSLGMTMHQVVTLASIVEEEAAVDDERPMIAGVFHNRLRKGMRLQSDPTVIYGVGDRYRGKIYKSDLTDANPYNTYVIVGLPPGPIAAPGEEALRAVLRPANTDALYFVARNDGTHVFSTTYARHKQAVEQYQR
ncbi:MAG: endolytic transglycosylase MltG [Deltaproteobacteria bacterium]|nr:endolytic transglycosylase MltG [Deltaproteobacteria bacterium]